MNVLFAIAALLLALKGLVYLWAINTVLALIVALAAAPILPIVGIVSFF